MPVTARLSATALAAVVVAAGAAPAVGSSPGSASSATSAAATGVTGKGKPRAYRAQRLAPGAESAGALAMNDRGDVAGWVDRGNGRRATLWRDGREILLDDRTDTGGGTGGWSVAERVTRTGDVLIKWHGAVPAGQPDSYVWSRGRTVPLPGGSAADLNEAGQVLMNGAQQRPWVRDWRRGKDTALPLTEGQILAFAIDLADDGTASGMVSETLPVCEGGTSCVRTSAVIWRHGRQKVVATSTGDGLGLTAAGAVTRTGAVLVMGGGGVSATSPGQVWVWRAGRLVQVEGIAGFLLPTLPLLTPVHDRINDRGQVIGSAAGEDVPVRWSAGKLTRLPLPTVAGEQIEGGETRDINERGQVVGSLHLATEDGAWPPSRRPILWDAHGTPHVLPGNGTGIAVNDRGQVVADVRDETGSGYTPVLYSPTR